MIYAKPNQKPEGYDRENWAREWEGNAVNFLTAIALYLAISLIGVAWMIAVFWLNRINHGTTERPLPRKREWRAKISKTKKQFVPELQHH